MLTVSQQIKKFLQNDLRPTVLKIIDESAPHNGHEPHVGHESHFYIAIASDKFQDKTMVEKHRLVYKSLGNLMEKIHAIRIDIV